jgi:hypothetical protein
MLANSTDGKRQISHSLPDPHNAPRSLSAKPLFLSPANDGDEGLFGCLEFILPVQLIKERLFVQFEVSNRCSDVQKLFSGIRDDSSNIMYKIS